MCYSGDCPFEDYMGECFAHRYKKYMEHPCYPHEANDKELAKYFEDVDFAFKEKEFMENL